MPNFMVCFSYNTKTVLEVQAADKLEAKELAYNMMDIDDLDCDLIGYEVYEISSKKEDDE